jgi:hypothetical protein
VIERVILLRCRDRSPAAVDEVAQAVLALLEGRPEVAGAAVDHPADAATTSAWDLRVTVRLADVAALDAYAQDPVHARFVETWLAPRSAAREAWTFRC